MSLHYVIMLLGASCNVTTMFSPLIKITNAEMLANVKLSSSEGLFVEGDRA